MSVDTRFGYANVAGDELLIERLLANLVDNALRHNVPNGHMNVVVGVNVGRAVLRVSNSGPGISADQVERLLQPFQRLETEKGGDHDGTGLGLSIVAAIARAHGARLSIEPRLEGGLDITVSFPPMLNRSGQLRAASGDADKAPSPNIATALR